MFSIAESSYIEYDKPDGFPDISYEEMSNWLNRFRGPLETKIQVYNIYKDILGENSDGALNTMLSIASLLGETAAFQECGDICIELIDLCEKVGKTDSRFYQLALSLLCNVDISFDDDIQLTVYNNPKVYKLLSSVIYKKRLKDENNKSKVCY